LKVEERCREKKRGGKERKRGGGGSGAQGLPPSPCYRDNTRVLMFLVVIIKISLITIIKN
jgi:hypothetical protein